MHGRPCAHDTCQRAGMASQPRRAANKQEKRLITAVARLPRVTSVLQGNSRLQRGCSGPGLCLTAVVFICPGPTDSCWRTAAWPSRRTSATSSARPSRRATRSCTASSSTRSSLLWMLVRRALLPMPFPDLAHAPHLPQHARHCRGRRCGVSCAICLAPGMPGAC